MRRRIAVFLLDVLAFCVPFLVGLAAAVWVVESEPVTSAGRLYPAQHAVEPFDADSGLSTAFLVLDREIGGAAGVLGAYGYLAQSGRFNVLTVAHDRAPMPVGFSFSAWPDRAFDEPGAADLKAGLIVLPSVAMLADSDTRAWIDNHASDSTWIVAACILNRTSDAHYAPDPSPAGTSTVSSGIERACDRLEAATYRRFTVDGRIVASRAATALADAVLHVTGFLADDDDERVDLAEGRPSDRIEPVSNPFSLTLSDWIARYMMAGFVWDKRNLGIAIFDGVDEVSLGAAVDLYARVYDADVMSVGATRRTFASAHGLQLIPQHGLDSDPDVHELLLPGEPVAHVLEDYREFAEAEEVPLHNPFGGTWAGASPYDATLDRIAAIRGSAVAEMVAKRVQYPVGHLDLRRHRRWPYNVLVVPITFGFLLMFVFRLARKRRLPSVRRRKTN
jgi:hypothetical protein